MRWRRPRRRLGDARILYDFPLEILIVEVIIPVVAIVVRDEMHRRRENVFCHLAVEPLAIIIPEYFNALADEVLGISVNRRLIPFLLRNYGLDGALWPRSIHFFEWWASVCDEMTGRSDAKM